MDLVKESLPPLGWRGSDMINLFDLLKGWSHTGYSVSGKLDNQQGSS